MRDVEVLLVVAHPDDDAIFAGALQRSLRAFRWGVVCVTWSGTTPRGEELLSWQTHEQRTPASRIAFLDQVDDPEDYRQKRCSLDHARVTQLLANQECRPRIVVTHNDVGEYGHPHHVFVHRVARAVFADCNFLFFGPGKPKFDLSVSCADKWPAVRSHFASQARVIDKLAASEETFVHDCG